jgi:hypothetical protein
VLLESHGALPRVRILIGGGSRGSKGEGVPVRMEKSKGGQSQTAVQGEELEKGGRKENRSFVLAGALRARFVKVVFIE